MNHVDPNPTQNLHNWGIIVNIYYIYTLGISQRPKVSLQCSYPSQKLIETPFKSRVWDSVDRSVGPSVSLSIVC